VKLLPVPTFENVSTFENVLKDTEVAFVPAFLSVVCKLEARSAPFEYIPLVRVTEIPSTWNVLFPLLMVC
jgi:hypothetical protein